MLTLDCVSYGWSGGFQVGNIPVNASAGETGSHATCYETVLFEVLDVPRLDTGGTKENAATLLESVVEPTGLL